MKPLFKYHVELQLKDGRVLKSWGVCPIGQTPILDGIYDPETKHLRLFIDSTQENLQPVEVMGENGKVKREVRRIQEYYRMIIPSEDLDKFLDLYVENNFEYSGDSFLEQPVFSERRAEVSEPVIDEMPSM